jgi:hypothetical protein
MLYCNNILIKRMHLYINDFTFSTTLIVNACMGCLRQVWTSMGQYWPVQAGIGQYRPVRPEETFENAIFARDTV